VVPGSARGTVWTREDDGILGKPMSRDQECHDVADANLDDDHRGVHRDCVFSGSTE
jgi:hypothetical protein